MTAALHHEAAQGRRGALGRHRHRRVHGQLPGDARRHIVAALLDEIAFSENSDEAANTDSDIVNAVRLAMPSIATKAVTAEVGGTDMAEMPREAWWTRKLSNRCSET